MDVMREGGLMAKTGSMIQLHVYQGAGPLLLLLGVLSNPSGLAVPLKVCFQSRSLLLVYHVLVSAIVVTWLCMS
jgi:hypothetical protein